MGRAKKTGAERALVLRSERVLARVEWLIDGNASHYHPYTFYEEITGVVDDWYRQLTMQVAQSAPARARGGRYRAGLPRPGAGSR